MSKQEALDAVQGSTGPEGLVGAQDGTGGPRANGEYTDDQLKQCRPGNWTKLGSRITRTKTIYPTYLRQSIYSKLVINLLIIFREIIVNNKIIVSCSNVD